MTWKTALADLPFGGAKSGIVADVKNISLKQKRNLLFYFGRALKFIAPRLYVAAPDINTGEREMQWFVEGNGSLKSATGKPKRLRGIPHEYGITGYGVAQATLMAAKHIGLNIYDAIVAIEGFGNVGSFTAHYLSNMGANIVAVSDSKGVIYNKEGIDVKKLAQVKKKTGTVIDYELGRVLQNKEIFTLPVDILIPAALPDVINRKNVNYVETKIVVEAANIPATPAIGQILHERSILVVPDFAANAGGVISSYTEYCGHGLKHAFDLTERIIKKNVKLVLEKAEKEKVNPRDAALEIAKERVRKAMVGLST